MSCQLQRCASHPAYPEPLSINSRAQLAGVSDEDVIGQRWDGFFQLPYSRDSMPFRAVADIALRDGDFVVNGATVLSAAGNATFAMRFK